MNKHHGSSLDDLLDELGERQEVEALAAKKIVALRPNLIVYSQQAIENASPRTEPHIIISIRTPKVPGPTIPYSSALLAVLITVFPDLDENYKALHPEDRREYSDDQLFNEKHANEILDFVARYRAHVETIVVQCEGGLSRSPAVKAALDVILNDDKTPYNGTNRLVYKTLLETAAARAK